jgi:hypothetical protein
VSKKYVTTTNAEGQLVHTTWRVWWEDGGYSSYPSEEEARQAYDDYLRAARLDRHDTTILTMRERM